MIRRGYTLIELLVVIAIIGVISVSGYSVLSTLISERFSGTDPLALEGLFAEARVRAMAEGKTITLFLNFEDRKLGLIDYDPSLENNSNAFVTSLYRPVSIMNESANRSEEEAAKAEKPKEIRWISGSKPMPTGLKSMLATSGMALPENRVFLHFYPNGSSDSVFFIFENGRKKEFMLLPRQNIPVRRFDEEELMLMRGDVKAQ